MTDKHNEPIDGGNAPAWGGIAYCASTLLVADHGFSRAQRVTQIVAMMSRVCVFTHNLAVALDGYTPDQQQSAEEQDLELRTEIQGKVLVLAYLFPGAERTIRSLEIAHELGVPTFIVCESEEVFLPELEPSLRNAKVWISINTSKASLDIMTQALDQRLLYQRSQIPV